MAYTELDSANPQASQTPSNGMASSLANFRALRDGLLMGRAHGFVQSRTTGTGTAIKPQYITWWNVTLAYGIRAKFTWTGDVLTSVQWQFSTDNLDATYTANVISTNTFTWDASNNMLTSDTDSGIANLVFEVWVKTVKVVSDLATHSAATGTSVHGLGTMATQNATAIAVTGGAVDGVTQGGTTPGNTDVTRAREVIHDYGLQAAAATVTSESDKYGYVKFKPSVTTTDTLNIGAPSGAPAAGRTQCFMMEIVNGQRSADGKLVWDAAYHWVGGSGTRPNDLSLEASGSNLFAVQWNGSSWDIQHLGKRG